MAENKKGNLTAVLLVALLIAAAVGFYLYQKQTGDDATASPAISETLAQDQAPEDTIPAVEEEVVDIDTAAAIKDRILGDPNAPVKISEHSSFTCPHCANFHKSTFKALKEQYIDTGKAYLVFSDFPLNAPAMHASMATRCAPEDQYFDFVEDLFINQEEWAFEATYLNLLQKKAEKYGLGPKAFKACLDKVAIQEGILNRMRAAQAQWKISSTPSFVINNKTTLTGGQSIETFSKAIEEAMAPKTEDAPASEAGESNE